MKSQPFRWALLAVLVGVPAAQGFAQGGVVDTLAIADKDLFHRRDLLVAAGFVAGTAAMLPFDQQLTSRLRKDYLGSADVRRVVQSFRFLGGTGAVLIGSATFLGARVSGHRRIAELSLHTTEAMLVASTLTSGLKVVAGRERPYASADTNAHRFRWFHGKTTGAFSSFPSGHAATAFGAAAAIVAETAEHFPRRTRIVAPLAYAIATGVGLSRLYDDRHWASDVVMGAAVGTFTGLKIVRFNHTHTGNRIDRWLLGDKGELTVLPGRRSIGLLWSARTPFSP